MTDSLKAFMKLKDEAEKARREEAQLQGAISQLQTQLKKEHGCKTIEEAEELVEKLKREQVKHEKQFQKELREYEEEFSNKSEEGDNEQNN